VQESGKEISRTPLLENASEKGIDASQALPQVLDRLCAEQSSHDTAVTVSPAAPDRRLIAELAWTPDQVIETRMRLRTFEEDWDAPGMEAYDDL
jgi:hypothetical protein